MRIAIAVPPIRDFYLTPHRLSYLGPKIVSELCQREGHTVKLFFFPSDRVGKTIPLPPEAAYLYRYLLPTEHGPVSFFTHFRHFGPSYPDCARTILSFSPDLVIISSFAYAYAVEAVELGREIRRQSPTTLLAVGGAGPSAEPRYYASQIEEATLLPIFNFIVQGEAEMTLPLLLQAATSAFPPLFSSVEQEPYLIKSPRTTSPEDLLPLVGIVRQNDHKLWAATYLSRGCPFQCSFCSNHLCHGREFRILPTRVFLRAIKQLPSSKTLSLNFEDDNLLAFKEEFLELLKQLRNLFPDSSFTAENGLDYRFLDPALIDRLLTLGFRRFNLSLGTLYEDISRSQARPLDLDRYLAVVRHLHRKGIPSVTYFIAGLPGDSPQQVLEHLKFLSQVPTRVGISLFYPVPGIEGFNPPPPLLLQHPGLSRGSFAYPWTGVLSDLQFLTAFRLSRYINLQKKTNRTLEEEALLATIQQTQHLYTYIKTSTGLLLTTPPVDSEMETAFFNT
ncbi:MAG: B12-binding domain-containing radical SAM protein [Spirochaetales bacterium]